uniref:MD-2-related lipid-recognition domain-containing protein n=1 Tax=Anopheles farauti TaxID=69004 RepID=A0A182Q1P9_9DIPT
MSTATFVSTWFVVCVTLCSVLACKDGVNIKVNNVENCAGVDGIITLTDNTAVTLLDDCSLSLEGCLKTKSFSTATGTVKVFKNGKQLFKKPIDLCAKGSKIPFIGEFLPGGVCPQSENEICADPNRKIQMERFKKMIGIMKGSMAVELELDHDTGKSCIKIEVEVSK